MLQLNGIQHYAYCPRRWALITIEQVWQDNADTMIGQYVHRNVDNPFYEEIFNNKIISRSVPVFSYKLGIMDYRCLRISPRFKRCRTNWS